MLSNLQEEAIRRAYNTSKGTNSAWRQELVIRQRIEQLQSHESLLEYSLNVYLEKIQMDTLEEEERQKIDEMERLQKETLTMLEGLMTGLGLGDMDGELSDLKKALGK